MDGPTGVLTPLERFDELELVVDVDRPFYLGADSTQTRPVRMNIRHRHVRRIDGVRILKCLQCGGGVVEDRHTLRRRPKGSIEGLDRLVKAPGMQD